MIERILVAGGMALIVTLVAWVIFVLAALLDRVIPAYVAVIFCFLVFVLLFAVDLATTPRAPRSEDEE